MIHVPVLVLLDNKDTLFLSQPIDKHIILPIQKGT